MPEVAHKIKFYIGDVRNKSTLKYAMKGVDYVFHAAALKQVPSCEFFPMETVKTNVIGTDNVLGCAFGRMKGWKVLLIGGGFSVLIETLQFVLKRGFAEFDDVFHNVLGCLIGFGVYVGVRLVADIKAV